VVEAISLGVNEFVLKPVSSNSLQDRLEAALTMQRLMVQTGNYYGPTPRRPTAVSSEFDVVKLVLVD
jgi:FixJ family two-component response regulator